MSLQSRYDSLLKDMISLLQQALFRFFTQKQVDLIKFKHYFSNFLKNMKSLQQNFHQKSVKFSKNLSKLSELFATQANASNKFSLQPTPLKVIEPSQSISKPKTSHNHRQLNIIGEQQQEYVQKQRQKRSFTAQAKRRSQNFVIDFSQGKFRPKTGVNRQNKRYSRNNPGNVTSQTIDHQTDYSNNFKTLNSREIYQNQDYPKKERKNFYNQLQKQYNDKAAIVYENMVKIPKKKSLGTHRWSFKINKLF